MSAADSKLELLRSAFSGVASVREVRMFGGVAFLVKGHMTVAVSPRGLLVRVGPAEHERALERLGTRAMEMRGRVMTGYVYVDPFPDNAQSVHSWLQSALRYNRTLPAKNADRTASRKRRIASRGAGS